MKKVKIIAEAGVNHNGDLSVAKKMISTAKRIGADAIKFQTFIAENLASKEAKLASYQKKTGHHSQYNLLKELELSFEQFIELKSYADKNNIEFMSTAFDKDSALFLAKLGIQTWKIPSGEITNLPYLRLIDQLSKNIIISTGMSTIDEIKNTLKVFKSEHSKITLLHCTSEYPAPKNEVNLKAINSMQALFKLDVGYSDHTEGIEVPIAAVALGATIIEKHFTLDKTMSGPDHSSSIEPHEFELMVNQIRNVESALGDGEKRVVDSELKNRILVRKSIFAKKNIFKGEVFSSENITTKRPGNGISPMEWDNVIGKKAPKNFQPDEPIIL